jgi:hypothetical protein
VIPTLKAHNIARGAHLPIDIKKGYPLGSLF